MDYKVEQLPNFQLHVIKTKKFKNVHVSIKFRRIITKNECTKQNVLINTLLETSKKYKTAKDIEIATEELYNSYININHINSGQCDIIQAATTFLNDKYTEKGQFNKAVDLLYELILNPDVKNQSFNEKSLNHAKEIVENNINSRKDYPSNYAISRLLEEIDKNHPISFNSNLKDLKKIDPTNLYEYYLDIINNDIIDIFVVGDVTSEMIKYVKKKFNFRKRNYQKLNHFLIEQNICKDLITKESLPINQSIICLGYVFDDLTDYERRYVMYLMNYVLGSGADSLLFKNVREKASLCYGINSSYNLLNGGLLIKSGIDKENFAKTKKLILEQVQNLKDGKFTSDDINKGKLSYKNSCISALDQIGGIANIYSSMCFINSDPIDEKIKKLNKVTKKEIVNLANKMHLSKIFFLEGDA